MEMMGKSRRMTRRKWIISAVLLILVLIVLYPLLEALFLSELPVNSGTVMHIGSGSYYSARFWVLTDFAQVKGSFVATNNVSLYIMEAAQYPIFHLDVQTGTHQGYRVEFWLEGVTSGSIQQVALTGGLGEAYFSFGTEPYYLVFYNRSNNSSTTVTITDSIALYSR